MLQTFNSRSTTEPILLKIIKIHDGNIEKLTTKTNQSFTRISLEGLRV